MNALGWVEGKNFRVEMRWGRGDRDLLQSHAQELVRIAPEVILTNGTPSTVALQRETSKIPIVFAQVTFALQGVKPLLQRSMVHLLLQK